MKFNFELEKNKFVPQGGGASSSSIIPRASFLSVRGREIDFNDSGVDKLDSTRFNSRRIRFVDTLSKRAFKSEPANSK